MFQLVSTGSVSRGKEVEVTEERKIMIMVTLALRQCESSMRSVKTNVGNISWFRGQNRRNQELVICQKMLEKMTTKNRYERLIKIKKKSFTWPPAKKPPTKNPQKRTAQKPSLRERPFAQHTTKPNHQFGDNTPLRSDIDDTIQRNTAVRKSSWSLGQGGRVAKGCGSGM